MAVAWNWIEYKASNSVVAARKEWPVANQTFLDLKVNCNELRNIQQHDLVHEKF